MKPTLALIIPVDMGAHPDQGLPKPPPGQPGQPPRPDNTLPGQLPRPSHPIFYPLPPGAPVDPSYGIPIEHPDQGLPGPQPTPTPPIAGKPPGTPDQGLPGAQPKPEHPIVLPPDAGGGWGPIYIWGGGPGARPPIALPPEGSTPPGKIEWETIWTPSGGWQTIGVVTPDAPVPTPSKK